MIIELPLPPKELHPNKPVVWRAKMKPKALYREQACAAAWNHRPAKPLEAASVRLVFYLRTKHRHDPDNLIAWMKAGIDGLCDAKIFADDKHLTYLPCEQVTDRKNPRVEVEITES